MPQSTVPASRASDGFWKVMFVPTGSNPLSVAILNGATSKDLTYGFTGSGFNYTLTQDTITDSRLTLAQVLSRPGRRTEALEVQFVDTDDTTSPAVVLADGVVGFLVIRRGVANDATFATGQKVDVLAIQAGADRPDAPTENGLDTITKTITITAATQRKALTVA